MYRLFPAAALCLAPLSALADPAPFEVTAEPCDWRARADAIVEPWQDNTRTYSDGKVRLAFLDTIEPAYGWANLLIVSPPHDELGGRQCRVIGSFSGLTWDTLAASYDPATGLSWTVEIQHYDSASDGLVTGTLHITLNQATGEITTEVR